MIREKLQVKKAAGKSNKMLLLIGGFKFVKAILLLAIAIGALKLIGKDLAEELKRLIGQLQVDPGNRYFQMALTKTTGLDEKKLAMVSAGTFFYSALFFAEGIGLLLQKRWGEILTIVITATFLPMEIYELIKEFTVIRVLLLLFNAAIVAYLIWRVMAEKQRRKSK